MGSWAEWTVYILVVVVSLLLRLGTRGRATRPGPYRRSRVPVPVPPGREARVPVRTGAMPPGLGPGPHAGAEGERGTEPGSGAEGEVGSGTEAEPQRQGPSVRRGVTTRPFDESFWLPEEAPGSLVGPSVIERSGDEAGRGRERESGTLAEGPEGLSEEGLGSEEGVGTEGEGPGAGERLGVRGGPGAGAEPSATVLEPLAMVGETLADGSGLAAAMMLAEVLGPPRAVLRGRMRRGRCAALWLRGR